VSVLLVTPHAVVRRATTQRALARARAAERGAKASHGPQAGADCYVVAELGDGSLWYRGMACGRRLIGRNLGCGEAVVRRAANALSAGQVRD
jgi:hypothetical protein